MDNGLQINQFGQFKQLIVGAGSSVFKAQGPWLWAGATTPSNSTFNVYLPTGALTTTGTINATGGTISGDLTVSGSILSDDGSGYQTKVNAGTVSFLKSGSQKAFIKTASGSDGVIIATTSNFYITNLAGVNLLAVDTSSNLLFSNNSMIRWPDGRSITADSSSMTASGNWLVLGGVRATDYTRREGSTDYAGDSGTFKDFDGRTIRVRGGLITKINE